MQLRQPRTITSATGLTGNPGSRPPTEGNWLLKGLKQTTILRWDVGSLQQLWSLPQWERQTEELWREDLLDQVL